MQRLLLLALALLLSLSFGTAAARQGSVDPARAADLRAQAEAYRAEGSYELARRAWAELLDADLAPDDERAVRVALEDCRWRAAAGAERVDQAELEDARAALEAVVAGYERPEQRDTAWAAAHASIADWHWTRRWNRNWNAAWEHYQAALSYWAASSDLDRARDEYLALARRALSSGDFDGWRQTNHLRGVPISLAERAVRVATDPEDVAWSNLYLALALRDRDPSEGRQRAVRAAFEAAVAQGAGEWSERALYHQGVWTEERGAFSRDEDGTPRTSPDYVAALALYRAYLERYDRDAGLYWNSARERVKNITGTEVRLRVESAFLPGSAKVVHLGWRNAEAIDLALVAVDLGRDVRLDSKDDGPHDWLRELDPGGRATHVRWTHATGDDGLHRRGEAYVEVPGEVPPGAYLLTARANGVDSRQLVLVSEVAVATKDTGEEVVTWVADVGDGRPRAEAEVTLYHRRDNDAPWKRYTAATDADGLARFAELGGGRGQSFAAVKSGADQAFAVLWGAYRWNRDGEWKLYTQTDRPAYRPGDEVQWKVVARVRERDVLETPSSRSIRYRLHDPRGNQVDEGVIELNEFGAAWGTFACDASWPLGSYSLQFLDDDSEQSYGSATAFRLEEYKLPEFRVDVVPATDEDGAPRLFRVGEPILAEVRAEYAFGGPVAGARVEVQVHAKPYAPSWRPHRKYAWYHREHSWHGWGSGEHLDTLQLVTDADGVARIEFAPEWSGEGAVELTFDARVTDSSRREVSGSGVVRATREAYAVNLEPTHRVHHPGDEVEVEIHARDANDRGLAVEGELLLERVESYEIWTDPAGRRFTGGELERERARYPHFPPAPDEPDGPRWTCAERGEHAEFIGRFPARTDEDGEGLSRIAIAREGTYRVRWVSTDRWGERVEAETRVFVAADGTRELGYRANGVELHLDRDTLSVGGEAVMLITTEEAGRWVLFSVEAGGLLDLRVVRVNGTAALLRLPVDERWVPNVTLDAQGFSNGRAVRDREDVVVPPERHFLDVSVTAEPGERRPGDATELLVTVHDADGEPVEAEVCVTVYDAMVEAIQQDPTIDPREFFYGELRRNFVSSSSSLDHLVYRELVSAGDDGWRDQAFGAAQGLRQNDVYLGMSAEGKKMDGRTRSALARPADSLAPGAVEMEMADEDGGWLADGAEAGGEQPGQGGADAQDGPNVVVRSDFRDTAFWSPDVRTDAKGEARVTWAYPDNLSTWKVKARAATREADFGPAETETITTKPLLVRVQAPRFLVVGDEAVVSANLNNRTNGALVVRGALEARGVEVVGALVDGELAAAPDRVTIPAGTDVRLDWLVRATATGAASFTATVVGDELSDGAVRTIPVTPYGIDALVAASGRVRGEEATFRFALPAARGDDTTAAYVQVAPNLALGLIDALPYLIEYPYGCTEQTLSRFVPAVIVKRTLEDFGLSAEVALERAFGGVTEEARAALFSGDRTSIDELDRVTAAGIGRLRDAQRGDGAWGWWPGGDADAWMTAYAVWGLALARDAGVEFERGMLDRGAEWLLANLAEEGRDVDTRAWMVHALASAGNAHGDPRFQAAFARAFEARGDLQAYGKALLCLAATRTDRAKEAAVLSRNLIDGAVRTQPDRSVVQSSASGDGTAAERAHWGRDRGWWRWSQGAIESTSFALWALLETDPDHELVEPASQWLMANRRAAQWTNTRDTSIAILALSSYLRRKGNLTDPVEYEVLVGSESIARTRLEGDALLAGADRVAIPARSLRDGDNEVVVRRVASANPLDVTVWAEFFTQEERIEPRGNEVFARRQYYRLVGRPTLLEGWVYDRVPLADGDELVSGERVECVVTLEAKTTLEYVLVEDNKPAGLEAGGVQSGAPLWASELTAAEARHRFGGDAARPGVGARDSGSGSTTGTTGRSQRVHQEWRDRTVGLFLDRVPEGVWEVRYELRAETPGRFQALPVTAEAMYVPEIRANGTNLGLGVRDRDDS